MLNKKQHKKNLEWLWLFFDRQDNLSKNQHKLSFKQMQQFLDQSPWPAKMGPEEGDNDRCSNIFSSSSSAPCDFFLNGESRLLWYQWYTINTYRYQYPCKLLQSNHLTLLTYGPVKKKCLNWLSEYLDGSSYAYIPFYRISARGSLNRETLLQEFFFRFIFLSYKFKSFQIC